MEFNFQKKTGSKILDILNINGPTPYAPLSNAIYNYQNNNLDPICPFELNDNSLSSKFLDLNLRNLIELKFIEDTDKGYELTKRGSKKALKKGNSYSFKEPFFILPKSEKEVLTILSEEHSLKYTLDKKSIYFFEILPLIDIFCSVFSLHPLDEIFKKIFPLSISDEMVFFQFGESTEIKNNKKFYKKMKANVYQNFGSNSIDNFEKSLELLFLYLLPYSFSKRISHCLDNHENRLPYKNYPSALLDIPSRCKNQDCNRALNNPILYLLEGNIANNWRNGAFFEAYLAKTLKILGFKNVYWHVMVDDIECDVLAFDNKRIIIGECKRSEDNVAEAERQIKSLESIFSEKVIKICYSTANLSKMPSTFDIVIYRKNLTKSVEIINEFLK